MSIRITADHAKSLGLPGSGKPRTKAKARERRPKAPPPRPEPPPRLLAIDPSSVAVGMALFESGVLRKVCVFRSSIEDPRRRIAKLAGATAALAATWCPTAIAFELVSGLHRHARSVSVATCSFAQGAIWMELEGMGVGCPVAFIAENRWTRGKPKKQRAELIRLGEPVYAEWARKDGDKGLDGADAVGLGLAYLGGLR